jgi:hypothetical protein
MRSLITSLLLILSAILWAQAPTGKVLVLANVPGQVLVDGASIGDAEPNKPLLQDVAAGDHLVQLVYTNKGKAEVKNEVITVEAGKQKVVNFSIDQALMATAPTKTEPLMVADLNVAIPGLLTGTTTAPEFYYAFEAGDEVLLDVTMSNLKGTNSLQVATYPGNVVKYSNQAFTELRAQSFKIGERGIYRFVIATNHVADRNAFVKVWRIPASADKAGFNTNVIKKMVLTPVQVCEKQEFFVNSGSNATFMGGKSRVNLPVSLPANTVEWYYRFAASREQADIEKVQQNAGLFTELGGLLLSGGSSALLAQGAQGFAGSLTQPPGANFCDIVLLDHANLALFETKVEYSYVPAASRANFKSGNVRVDCCPTGQWYLGIRNPDNSYGIHVFVDVVAITGVEELVMEGAQ